MYAELMQKKCSRCKEDKEITEFNSNRSSKDGKDHYCRTCKSIIKKEDYIKNREKIKKQVHESYKRNLKKNLARALKYRTENKEKVLALKRFQTTGVTKEQYDRAYNEQNGKCYICHRHESEFKKKLSADHCHKTGKFRSLLCSYCNTAIGLFKEDINLIKKAITYIEKHKK